MILYSPTFYLYASGIALHYRVYLAVRLDNRKYFDEKSGCRAAPHHATITSMIYFYRSLVNISRFSRATLKLSLEVTRYVPRTQIVCTKQETYYTVKDKYSTFNRIINRLANDLSKVDRGKGCILTYE